MNWGIDLRGFLIISKTPMLSAEVLSGEHHDDRFDTNI